MYKFKKIRDMTDFSDQFRKLKMRYKRIGYNLNVLRQSACLVINTITVDGYAAFFNRTPVDRASDRPGISIRNATHFICRVLVFASS